MNNFADLEEIKQKREEVHKDVLNDENAKKSMEEELECLSKRLKAHSESLEKKVKTLESIDQTIYETEEAYSKVYEFILIVNHNKFFHFTPLLIRHNNYEKD